MSEMIRLAIMLTDHLLRTIAQYQRSSIDLEQAEQNIVAAITEVRQRMISLRNEKELLSEGAKRKYEIKSIKRAIQIGRIEQENGAPIGGREAS